MFFTTADAAPRNGVAVLLSPLHAPSPTTPQEASPYYPSSRRWLNPLLAPLRGPLPVTIDNTPGGRIERDVVWAAKRHALAEEFAAERDHERWRWWAEAHGDDLTLFCVFDALADELGPAGVRVNGLLPGRIGTDRVAELDAATGDPERARAAALRTIPLGRYGDPVEFGRVAAFLLSPASSFVSGAMVPSRASARARKRRASAGSKRASRVRWWPSRATNCCTALGMSWAASRSACT